MQHVEHETHVLGVARRNARFGRVDVWLRPTGASLLGGLDAFFDFADTREVLVDLLAIATRNLGGQALHVALNEIEHGALLLLTNHEVLRALLGRAGAEKAFEKQARVDLWRERGGRRTPGEIMLIDAGVLRVARA